MLLNYCFSLTSLCAMSRILRFFFTITKEINRLYFIRSYATHKNFRQTCNIGLVFFILTSLAISTTILPSGKTLTSPDNWFIPFWPFLLHGKLIIARVSVHYSATWHERTRWKVAAGIIILSIWVNKQCCMERYYCTIAVAISKIWATWWV